MVMKQALYFNLTISHISMSCKHGAIWQKDCEQNICVWSKYTHRSFTNYLEKTLCYVDEKIHRGERAIWKKYYARSN